LIRFGALPAKHGSLTRDQWRQEDAIPSCLGESGAPNVGWRATCRPRAPCPRSNRNLPRRPLDDLDQHLLALLDAEMAIVPIELVAAASKSQIDPAPRRPDVLSKASSRGYARLAQPRSAEAAL